MKRALAVALVAMCMSAGVILAQAPPPMPKPGPAHKRIGYFVGKWTSEGEMKQSPFGPAGKYTGTDRSEWFPGGFFLVLHSDEKGPLGEFKALAVMGYNPDEKVYTYNAFNSMGMAESSRGTVQGDTWTWLSESKMGGKMTKSRFTIKEVSPTSYTYKFDTSSDGKTWTNIMEGKATKVK